jgi:hypothetical protein
METTIKNTGGVIPAFWIKNPRVFLRLVTSMFTGRVVDHQFDGVNWYVVLRDAAWIIDGGNLSETLQTGKFKHVVTYPDGVEIVVSLAGFVDGFNPPWPLPR